MAGSKRQLPGASKYLRPVVETSRFESADAEQNKANEVSDLRALLEEMGCSMPEGSESWKFKCPFGAEHEDGGMDRAARFYAETNSAFCFAGHGMLTPVRLVAMREGVTQHRAAQMLLAGAGTAIRKGWRDRFVDLTTEEQALAPRASLEHVVAALTMRLQAHEGYQTRQYDADFREAMHEQIEALAGVEATVDAFTAWVEESVDRLAPMLTH